MLNDQKRRLTETKGIYMENGSGGFLSDLYFVGGKFGYYLAPLCSSATEYS
jgi:hypothetical protein